MAQKARARGPDYILMACTTASVSYKTILREEELLHALTTGKVPDKRSAHLLVLFEEAPEALLQGLARQASRWIKPEKLKRNIRKLANALDIPRTADRWSNSD